MTVRLLRERRYAPPRRVQVEHEGAWLAGWLLAWRLLDDGEGWHADVQYTARYEWGLGCHVSTLPAARVRPSDDDGAPAGLALVVGTSCDSQPTTHTPGATGPRDEEKPS